MPFGRVAASVTPCGRRSRPQRVKSLRSKVEYNLAVMPPHRSRDESRPPCSGQQGSGLPAAGADSVSHRRSVRQLTSPPRIRAASHRLRRYPRISIVAWSLYSRSRASSREPLCPASTPVPRTGWAVPAQATEAVCPHTSSVSSAAPEPAAPYFQTASVANAPLASLVPRPWSLVDSLSAPTTPPTFLPSMRLPTTKAYQETHASASLLMRPTSPARRGGKWNIHIHLEAAAGAAAGTNTL